MPTFRPMNPAVTRRHFLKSAATAAAGAALAPPWLRAAGDPPGFSFVFLGDLHYDKLEHHDIAWLAKNHPADRSQIENDTRIMRDIMPHLFATVLATIAEHNQSAAAPIAFVLHAGDVVEGLCGSEELSVRQNAEALAFVRDAKL